MAVQFSIGSQASSPISKAITVSNINFQFEIKINKLDQLQGMTANIVANRIQTHAGWCWSGYGFESHLQPFLLTCPEVDLAYYF